MYAILIKRVFYGKHEADVNEERRWCSERAPRSRLGPYESIPRDIPVFVHASEPSTVRNPYAMLENI